MSKVIFTSEDRKIDPIYIYCKSNDNISTILKIFGDKNSINIKDFDFYYNKEKIVEDKSLISLTKDETIKDVMITFKKKSKIIKCPECDCNDAVLHIKNYRLNFYGCIYGHEISNIFDRYESTQHIEIDKIECKTNRCGQNQINELKDFHKCLKCSKNIGNSMYFCPKCSSKHHHQTINYDEKYYYCEEHYKDFKAYCKSCKKNLCEECEIFHNKKKHIIKRFEDMNPQIKSIKKQLEKIKEKIEDVKIIVDQIKNNMDGAVKMLEKYCEISEDILLKYELFNSKYKNYQILQSVNFLADSNKNISKDLEIITNSDRNWKKKCDILIDIFESDRKDYTNDSNKTNNNSIDEENEFEDNNNRIEVNEIRSDINSKKSNKFGFKKK